MDIASIGIIVVGTVIGVIVYQLRANRGDFDHVGPGRRLWTRVTITAAFTAVPSFGYGTWKANGFQQVDAQEAAKTMEQRYIGQGAARTDAEFIITGRSTMSGYVNVTMPDGTSRVLACKAEKGEGDEYLVFCKP